MYIVQVYQDGIQMNGRLQETILQNMGEGMGKRCVIWMTTETTDESYQLERKIDKDHEQLDHPLLMSSNHQF